MWSALKEVWTRVANKIYFRAGGVRGGGIYAKTRGMKDRHKHSL